MHFTFLFIDRLFVLLGIFVIVALVASGKIFKTTIFSTESKCFMCSLEGSSSDPAKNNEFVPRTVNNGTGPCSQYAILDEAWRNIPSSGVARPGTALFCDKPGSASANVKVREGWYRFEEPAGTYIPTEQHWTGEDAVRVSKGPFRLSA